VDGRFFGSLPEQIPSEAVEGVHVVVHCAAQMGGGERSAFAVNVEGTIRLAQLARRAGAETFIFLSSQSARPDALSTYGKTKYAAEQRLLAETGLRVIILRPGLVTGPGSRGLFRRMSTLVESLPVVPLLGGGHAIVQPIHIDDLCEAVFRCDEMARELQGGILHLGDPEGLTLAEFLRAMALARLGRPRLTMPIPMWPVAMVVRAAERLRIPLPITTNNLKGLQVVERMDTAADLARLRLQLRPLPEMLWDDGESPGQVFSQKERAIRVLVVGAGRIGLVHAITLSRLAGVVLAGLVDPNKGARALFRGMGVSAPMFGSLAEALTGANPDAVVIATPGSTHLTLTRACLAHGLAIMVEKPLAVRREQLDDFVRLAQEFPGWPVQVGYVMLRNPQIATFVEGLRAGRFGKVRSFLGITLLSLIRGGRANRWETDKNTSGGGAWINAGGHVLSMIRAAFGDPRGVEAQTLKLYSREVEDSVAVSLTYPEFTGTHYCSWSIEGYPRQENLLVVRTDRGRLILTGSVAVFVGHDGEVDLAHQLDFNVGFNLAPDYAGAGFTTELKDLEVAARTGEFAPMNLTEAAALERLLFDVYDASREVKVCTIKPEDGASPSAGRLRLLSAVAPPHDGPAALRRVLDLRDLSGEAVREYFAERAGEGSWDEYLVGPGHMKGLARSWPPARCLRVTVPDFLNQSRLLSTGQYGEVFRQMGVGGALAAVRAAGPRLVSERAPTFWVAALGLLGAALHPVPREFPGTILLHSYLTDFSFALRRLEVLDKMLAMCRRLRPRARVGFHTNMPWEALNALRMLETPVDEISVLTSPRAVDMHELFRAMRQGGTRGGASLTAEVGLAPSIVHRLAFDAPQYWALGAEAVLIGPAADPVLGPRRQEEVRSEWAKVFPGLDLPEHVL
jgi:predicted dehydrogenase/nucleoside-diphosphate-sugar epimerase